MVRPTYSDNTLLALFNEANSPGDITSAFADEDIGIERADAERIIAKRKAESGGRFNKLEQVEHLLGDSPFATRLKWPFQPISSTKYPVLLLPIRLETRFLDNSLCIRIYPDTASLDNHDPRLSVVTSIAGQNVYRSHQLGIGIHHHGSFMPFEAAATAFAPMAHLRVVHRRDPVPAYPFRRLKASGAVVRK